MNRIFKLFEEETITHEDLKKAIKEAGLKFRNKVTTRKTTYMIDDPKNKRNSSARDFADKHGAEFQIGNKISGSTPTVFWGPFELRFKDMKAASGNQGHAYEKEMIKALKEKDVTKTEIKKLIDILDIELTDIYSVDGVGTQQNKRNIIWKLLPQKLVLRGYKNLDSIAEEVADILLKIQRGNIIETVYISNKTGPSARFVNSGLGDPGPDNENAKNIVEWIGADFERYIQGFKAYESGEGEKQKYEGFNPEATDEDITEFLDSAIGQGYIYMHPKHTFMMDESARSYLTRNPTNYRIAYPGVNRKQFNLTFETAGLKRVSIELRHTRAKLWPNMIQCSYVMR